MSLSANSVSWEAYEWDAERVVTVTPNTDDLVFRVSSLCVTLDCVEECDLFAYEGIRRRILPGAVFCNASLLLSGDLDHGAPVDVRQRRPGV